MAGRALRLERIAEHPPGRPLPPGRDAHGVQLLGVVAVAGPGLARDHAGEVEAKHLAAGLGDVVVGEHAGRLRDEDPRRLRNGLGGDAGSVGGLRLGRRGPGVVRRHGLLRRRGLRRLAPLSALGSGSRRGRCASSAVRPPASSERLARSRRTTSSARSNFECRRRPAPRSPRACRPAARARPRRPRAAPARARRSAPRPGLRRRAPRRRRRRPRRPSRSARTGASAGPGGARRGRRSARSPAIPITASRASDSGQSVGGRAGSAGPSSSSRRCSAAPSSWRARPLRLRSVPEPVFRRRPA